MTRPLIALDPADVAERLRDGRAVLVDIREADEFARQHIAGSISHPLSGPDAALALGADQSPVFTCRSGMRTTANAARLAMLTAGPAYEMRGGLNAWVADGQLIYTNRKAPLEMMRQVQIAAGTLVLAGVILGLTVTPGWFGLAAFVGAGLTFAGISGFCGMARVLALMPWNRVTA